MYTADDSGNISRSLDSFTSNGLMEIAGVDKAARSKIGVWKMQEWTYRHDMARVDIAGVDKSARYGKGGHCGNGQCGTIWQGWTLQEWTNQHDMAWVDIVGVDNAAPLWQGWTMQEEKTCPS